MSSPGARLPGSKRLNEFQLLMREWARLAPYNFVYAMRLPMRADVQRWRDAIDETMPRLGIDPARVEILQPRELEPHFEAELQRPFDSYEVPLRFFVVTEPSDAHWFGVTFDHWFADDVSSRLLLQQLYARYHPARDVPSAASPPQDGLAGASRRNPSPARTIGQRPTPTQPRSRLQPWSRWRDWRQFMQRSALMRSAYRVPFEDPLDFSVGTFRVTLPSSALDGIRKFARLNGATVHDVFLAATAQAIGAGFLPNESSRRDLIAVGTAMNARRFDSDANINCEDTGVRVSQYVVVERRPHDHPLVEVVRRIAQQTRIVKAAPRPDMIAPTRFMWRLNFTRRSKATFFIRGAPIAAGLSNVNLTGSWLEESAVTEFRGSGPTGPVIPILLLITTFRGRIFFDVTYRKTAFSRVKAQGLVNDIVARLPAL